MSNTSASMPRSISGVGLRVSPYSEWMGSPVRSSVPEAIFSPGAAAPRMPCSGENSATNSTASEAASRSMESVPARSTPVWLVISPIRFPRTAAGGFSRNTSIPGRTSEVGAAARGGFVGAQAARASVVSSSVFIGRGLG
jgi:hypothetical protein